MAGKKKINMARIVVGPPNKPVCPNHHQHMTYRPDNGWWECDADGCTKYAQRAEDIYSGDVGMLTNVVVNKPLTVASPTVVHNNPKFSNVPTGTVIGVDKRLGLLVLGNNLVVDIQNCVEFVTIEANGRCTVVLSGLTEIKI